jgi:hypothetical protein
LGWSWGATATECASEASPRARAVPAPPGCLAFVAALGGDRYDVPALRQPSEIHGRGDPGGPDGLHALAVDEHLRAHPRGAGHLAHPILKWRRLTHRLAEGSLNAFLSRPGFEIRSTGQARARPPALRRSGRRRVRRARPVVWKSAPGRAPSTCSNDHARGRLGERRCAQPTGRARVTPTSRRSEENPARTTRRRPRDLRPRGPQRPAAGSVAYRRNDMRTGLPERLSIGL